MPAIAPTPAESANLLLKLYELRTEEKLRRARAWFAYEFHPRSAKDILRAWLGPGHASAPYRMAISYWDMAASLVVQGAIDPTMFSEANTEHIDFYVKLRPYLAEVRTVAGYPDYLANLERVILAMPDAEARLAIYERYAERQATLAAEGKQANAWRD